MFQNLSEKITKDLPRDERNKLFELVANASENQIAREVGEAVKEKIMAWWYAMCDVRQKERGG